ncbi:MAG: glucosamine-6-phosphate deaminase [Planctomycetota bacterium]|nr:glucosamine-6-phosphate deaminase [Planctomycetota bacterium]
MRPLAGASLPTFVFDDRVEAERALAAEIQAFLSAKPSAVLGLATGNSPVGVYRELCAAHAAETISFADVTTFNLDEYLDLEPGHPHSFRRWMEARLFERVKPRATHLPECAAVGGDSVRAAEPHSSPQRIAEQYETSIRSAGGVDMQLLGIGRNGHIGFNEPGASGDSRTRVVDLHPLTRELAAATFGGIEHVPKRAITMGIATILAARKIRVLAFGRDKAEIVKRTLEERISPDCPATFLRGHADVKLFLDRSAAAAIAR